MKKISLCLMLIFALVITTISAYAVSAQPSPMLDSSENSILVSLEGMLNRNLGITLNFEITDEDTPDIQQYADSFLSDVLKMEGSGAKNIMYIFYFTNSNKCTTATSEAFDIEFSEAELNKIKAPMLNTEDILGERALKSINAIMDIAYDKGLYDAEIEEEAGTSTILSSKMSNYINYKEAVKNDRNQKLLYVCISAAVLIAILAVVYVKVGKNQRTVKIVSISASVLVLCAACAVGFYAAKTAGNSLNQVDTATVEESASPIGKSQVYDITEKLGRAPTFETNPVKLIGNEMTEWQYFTDDTSPFTGGYYAKYSSKELAEKRFELIKNWNRIYTDYELEETDGKNFKLFTATSVVGEISTSKYYLLAGDSIYFCYPGFSTYSEDLQLLKDIFSAVGLDSAKYIKAA